jgi:hypothetical protein
MINNRIEQRFAAYSKWRAELQGAVAGLRAWLHAQELSDGQVDQRLEQALATLQDDKLYVAFVAEFSRGKSELINAIFFAGFGGRVLPSSAGRTTMCPTELMYDPDLEPSVRLLPIETRASGTTIAEYKGFPEEWKTLPLDIKTPAQVTDVLRHIAEVTRVPRDKAYSLGLHIAENESQNGMPLTADGQVEIPKWRHAIINFPHPLLEQGLVILDTPGLNALGAEPELTLNMLPSAHAVMFILAADTGVTKSDILVWQEHLGGTKASSTKGRLVVLNKIDGLWDDLRNWDDVQREIDRQITETARHLSVDTRFVFPVSAQKALLGKVKGDGKILERSRITALEDALAKELIPAKREIVSDNIRDEMAGIIQATRLIVQQRLKGVHEHMEELGGLSGKNLDVIDHMMGKVRVDKEHFEKSLQRFQATRSIFSQQTNVLYGHLNLKNLDKVIAETKKNMEISVTTLGLRGHMQSFFKYAYETMEEVTKQTQEIKALMDGVYRKFQEEHGLSNVKPASFSVAKYMREIKRLEAKNEQFMNGMSLAMTAQMAVVKKFFESAVSKVRGVFATANRDADNWLKTIMSPMESQVREHQVQLRRRLESIKRIHQASDTLEDRMNELKQVQETMRDQEKQMEAQANEILQILSHEEGAQPGQRKERA